MSLFKRDIKASLKNKRMNLYQAQTFGGIQTQTLLISALVIAVLIFGKFAVYDRLRDVSDARQNYFSGQDTLNELNAAAADYDEIFEQYSRQGQNYKTEAEAALADRMDMLELIYRDCENLATVKSVSIIANTATVELEMTGCQNASTLREILSAEENVLSVSSETAEMTGAQLADKTDMTLVIVFRDVEVAET